jgi:general secretion pathway protein I
MNRQASNNGFTLIEVLVALAIVAVTLAAGIKAAGALTNNAQRVVEVTSAQWCAENQFTELRLMRAFPGIGETDFTCEQFGTNYLGKLVFQATPNPDFLRVDAKMSREDGNPILTLSTVIGRSS